MNYIHNHDDYATEPVRGLPAVLPRGEFVLWQGRPSWRVFAQQVFHTRTIAVLVAAAALARAVMSLNAGAMIGTALGEAAVILGFGLAGIAILSLLAWLVQKTTVYTITNKRIVMRIGVAIQKTFNIPFATMDGAALKMHSADTGSVSVILKPDVSLAYLILWPHARPWRMRHTEPTLRAIPKAENVARLLTDAFTSHAQTAEAVQRTGAKQETLTLDSESSQIDDTNAASTGQQKLKDPHHIPRHLVVMAAAIVVLTVVIVGVAQWTDTGTPGSNNGTLEFSQDLRFAPMDGGRIAVIDVATGDTVTMIEAGTDGLIRGALRGLGMSRDAAELDPNAPYQLQRFAESGVYLSDALTGRSIRLESFGPLETGATVDLLRLGRSSQ